LRFQPAPLPSQEAALQQAMADRIEMKIAAEQVKIAEALRKAAVADWFPFVSVFGDYGNSGLKPNEIDFPTRSIGVRVDFPVFNGGRTHSEIQAASSLQRQAELQFKDLQVEVEKDVTLALKNLATREQQARAAEKTVALAERELQLAQDRFSNGVGDNVEVVNAQTALANARLVLVSSLAQFNVARLDLAAAMGHVEDFRL
jgi:outer membrane protein TolC